VDELNAALGLARATASEEFVGEHLVAIQKTLVDLMGELATETVDLDRHQTDGYARVTTTTTTSLEKVVLEIEARNITYRGWATPGATVHSAALDLARTACRRAERRVCALREAGELPNAEILIYLNRLSDLLWLFARWVERPEAMLVPTASPAP
jgi:cob(I)alamin adenosyltransferase